MLSARDTGPILINTGAISAAGDVVGGHKIVIQQTGASAEQLDELRKTLLATISSERSVPLKMLQHILASFGDEEVLEDTTLVEERLRKKADEYRDLVRRLERLTNDDFSVQKRRREAAALLEAGHFDAADAKLAEAEKIDMDAVQELEASAARRRLSAAESRAERGDTAWIERSWDSYRRAADHYQQAAQIIRSTDTALRFKYLKESAWALANQGHECADEKALLEAISLYKSEILPLAPRENARTEWANVQFALGQALRELGRWEEYTDQLLEAVQAFSLALEELPREPYSDTRARAHLYTANALEKYGHRLDDNTKLEEAVVSFRAALSELRRENDPIFWSVIQSQLGGLLRELARSEAGTSRLEGAAAAFRRAVDRPQPEGTQRTWISDQIALAHTLRALGERSAGTAELAEALTAYDTALQRLASLGRRDEEPACRTGKARVLALLDKRKRV